MVDFLDTPASDRRPEYTYLPLGESVPYISIITAYYNTGPVFQETIRCIQRMTFPHWEWLVVNDGSTDPSSLAQLDSLAALDPRIRILHQENAGPAVARNHGAREAQGRYVMLLDSDDLVEPTFLEKAFWLLETQPQFAACNSHTVTFGAQNTLWPYGFEQGERNLVDNFITNQCVVRRSAFLAVGGFDEGIRHGHEDWDLWLRLAAAGYWGYTIPEYLTWYRRGESPSRMDETEGDLHRAIDFQRSLRSRYGHLRGHFPAPKWTDPLDAMPAEFPADAPIDHRVRKQEGLRRVLLIVPWFQMGGADKINIEIIRSLQARGYQTTVVATMATSHPWLHHFTSLTPDVFCVSKFLAYGDYPRFLSYLIRSRAIDAIILSNSELGYDLAPFLHAAHPTVPILDYTHMEDPERTDGGYPGISAASPHITLSLTCSEHLRHWMIDHGASETRVRTCYAGVDTSEWTPDPVQAQEVRVQLSIPDACPVIAFVGRIVDQKRPLAFVDILCLVAEKDVDFVAVIIGDGPLERRMRRAVSRARLGGRFRFVGARSSDDVRRMLTATDILLLPSRAEGLALVLYEAMAVGVVPVAADVGGQRELVTPDCGRLVGSNPGDIDGYAMAVIDLVSDPTARAAMAANARQRVRDKYDMRQFGSTLDKAIHTAITAVHDAPIGMLALSEKASVHARLLAYRDVEQAEVLRSARAQTPLGGRVRRLREVIVPMGSARYDAYRLARQRLRQLIRSTRARTA